MPELLRQVAHLPANSMIYFLSAAQEAERTRIARDLHDDVSEQLAGFSIALSNLKRQIVAWAFRRRTG